MLMLNGSFLVHTFGASLVAQVSSGDTFAEPTSTQPAATMLTWTLASSTRGLHFRHWEFPPTTHVKYPCGKMNPLGPAGGGPGPVRP